MARQVLDRHLTMLRVTMLNGPSGAKEQVDDIGKIWASRADVSDAEKLAAGQIQSTVVARFVTPANTASRKLRPKDRLSDRGMVFHVTGIKEFGARHMLEITAEALGDG